MFYFSTTRRKKPDLRRLFSRSARVRTLRVRTAPLVQLKRSLDYHSRRLTRRFRRYGSRVDNSRRRGVRALSARFALSTGFPSCAPLARTSAPVSGISGSRRPRARSRSQINKTSLLYNFRARVVENVVYTQPSRENYKPHARAPSAHRSRYKSVKFCIFASLRIIVPRTGKP